MARKPRTAEQFSHVCYWHLADILCTRPHVRFWHLADIDAPSENVRFRG